MVNGAWCDRYLISLLISSMPLHSRNDTLTSSSKRSRSRELIPIPSSRYLYLALAKFQRYYYGTDEREGALADEPSWHMSSRV
jgi:hypothetical protein